MKTAAALVLLCFCLEAAGAQAKFNLESPLFLPSTFYVGDSVEMRMLIRTAEELREPAQALRIGWGVVHELRIIRHGDRHEIKIFFTAYMPGTQTFPVMRLGAVTLPELKVHVRSLAEAGYTEISPPRAQVVLPGTRLMLGLLAAAGLGLPLSIFLFLRFGRGQADRLLAVWRLQRPRRQLQRALKSLTAGSPALDSRSFYFQLLDVIRTYLTARLGLELASSTTRELMQKLPARVGDLECLAKLEDLFQFGDAVKFGRREAPDERRRRDLALAGGLESRLAGREAPHADI